MTDRTLYDVLHVTNDAPLEVIKASYRSLSTKYHPDKNNGSKIYEDAMKELNAAYAILSDATKRAEYDESLDWARHEQEDIFEDSASYHEPEPEHRPHRNPHAEPTKPDPFINGVTTFDKIKAGVILFALIIGFLVNGLPGSFFAFIVCMLAYTIFRFSIKLLDFVLPKLFGPSAFKSIGAFLYETELLITKIFKRIYAFIFRA